MTTTFRSSSLKRGHGTPFDQLVAAQPKPAPKPKPAPVPPGVCPDCAVVLTREPDPGCENPEHWLHYGR